MLPRSDVQREGVPYLTFSREYLPDLSKMGYPTKRLTHDAFDVTYPPPCGQIGACENITFPQLHLQAVKMPTLPTLGTVLRENLIVSFENTGGDL